MKFRNYWWEHAFSWDCINALACSRYNFISYCFQTEIASEFSMQEVWAAWNLFLFSFNMEFKPALVQATWNQFTCRIFCPFSSFDADHSPWSQDCCWAGLSGLVLCCSVPRWKTGTKTPAWGTGVGLCHSHEETWRFSKCCKMVPLFFFPHWLFVSFNNLLLAKAHVFKSSHSS